MKACFLSTPAAVESNPLQYGEFAKPKPAAGEVLVRVQVCGVCRTDLHVIEGDFLRKGHQSFRGTKWWGGLRRGAQGRRGSRGDARGNRVAAQDGRYVRILPARRREFVRCAAFHRV